MNSLWSNDGLCDIGTSLATGLFVLKGWGWTYHRRTRTLKWSNRILGVGNGAGEHVPPQR
jgi:hypothetical protein